MSRTPITDPWQVPIRGDDAHLPALDPVRLTPEAVRRRFADEAGRPQPFRAELPGDGHVFDRPPAHAAVLVPLVTRAEGLQVLLTQRTAHLHDHAGQISFPGGRSEPYDADAAATALREANEEIGLAARHVELLGPLPTYTTVTHFVVTPIVALVHPPFDLRPDANEVARVWEVPLAFLMTPANHRWHVFGIGQARREFLSMPWRPAPDDPDEAYVWGATASMLRNLYRFLAD